MIKNKRLLWIIGSLMLIGLMFTLALNNGFNKAATTTTVVTAYDNVKVYKNTTFKTANVVGTLKKGSKVTVTAVKENYTKVKLNNTYYYVETKYVDFRKSYLTKKQQTSLNKAMVKSKKIKKQVLYNGKVTSVKTITVKKQTTVTKKVTTPIVNFNTNLQKQTLNFNNNNITKGTTSNNTVASNNAPVKPKDVSDDVELSKILEQAEIIGTDPGEKPKDTSGSGSGNTSGNTSGNKSGNTSGNTSGSGTVTTAPVAKDTVTIYDESYAGKNYAIILDTYNVLANGTPYYSKPNTSSKIGTMNIGDKVYPTPANNSTVIKEVDANRKSSFVMVDYKGNDVYVERGKLTANYLVFKSDKAIKEGWNYNVQASSSSSTFMENGKALPMYDAPNIVTASSSVHDPIYDTLKAGTKVIATAVTNGSTTKPIYGTGASTSVNVASKGNATADGWNPAKLTNRYYNSSYASESGRNSFIYDFVYMGFVHNPNVLLETNSGAFFKTADGSRLDVNMVVNSDNMFGEFIITGYSKTEAYRTKKMLEITLPYMFDKKYSDAVVKKVYDDFIAYANTKPSTSKTVQYSGFKAVFTKVATDKYKLSLH